MISKYGETYHPRALNCFFDDPFGLLLALDAGLLSAEGRVEVESMIRKTALVMNTPLPRTPEISFTVFSRMFWGKQLTFVMSEMAGRHIECGDAKLSGDFKRFCMERCNQAELLRWAGLDDEIERQINPWFLLNAVCENAPVSEPYTLSMLLLRALGYPPVKENIQVVAPRSSRRNLWTIGDMIAFSDHELFRIGYTNSDTRVAVHTNLQRVFDDRLLRIAVDLSGRLKTDDSYEVDNTGDLARDGKTYSESEYEPIIDCMFVDFRPPEVPKFMRNIFVI